MQTELFDLPSPRTLSEEPVVAKTSFLEKTFLTLRLDQAIGLALVLLVLYVLIYSWGVEKGKRSSLDAQPVRPAPTAVLLTEDPSPAILETRSFGSLPVSMPSASVSADLPVTVEELPKPVAQVSKPEGKFTIQHVTYITQSAADREIQKLSKMGHRAFVIPSGRHLQVCIEGFQTRQEASQLLSQLRAKRIVSADAYIRPMVR